MPYAKNYPGGWQNLPAVTTPITAATLDKIETQYDQAMADTPKRVRKTADQTVNDSVVLVNDTHLLFAVLANEIWEFVIGFRTFTTTVNPDIDFAFAVPAGGSMVRWNLWSVVPNTESDGTAEQILALAAATIEYASCRCIYIGAATPGNVQLQWAQHVAVVEDTKILENSFIIARQLA